MIRRTLNPGFLNYVINHPDVRPMLGGEGALDLTDYIADPANIALEAEYGGWLLVRQEPGVYQLHTQFLKAGRGRAYFEAAREALRYVFGSTDAVELTTRVPLVNRGAHVAAKVAGFEERFVRKNAIVLDGAPSDVSFQALTLEHWMATDETLPDLGRWFHDRLEAAKREAGSVLETHPDDDAHDRAVGAAVLMMRAGNTVKAAWAYNRWASLAGYQTIEVLSLCPAVIDVRDAVIEVRQGEMEVLLCR